MSNTAIEILKEKKKKAIKKANDFQEKADKWYGLAKSYNEEIVSIWIKEKESLEEGDFDLTTNCGKIPEKFKRNLEEKN
jgi:hypothetical protein